MKTSITTPKDILHLYGEQERLVQESERRQITGISRSTWWRLDKAGKVPDCRRVGGRTLWLLSDLLMWCNGKSH
ncbi:MAG: hypothetical protein CMQ46_10435 [Gammaproteobacteria bacterium]|nr:hypothetical protein [Gammaproteobacteria bacterium]MBJ55664.1 hypothetical protein [Gammaproteobacteria bacterium]HBN13544.1 hypothetical protein [Pseudohongiella sp.]